MNLRPLILGVHKGLKIGVKSPKSLGPILESALFLGKARQFFKNIMKIGSNIYYCTHLGAIDFI